MQTKIFPDIQCSAAPILTLECHWDPATLISAITQLHSLWNFSHFVPFRTNYHHAVYEGYFLSLSLTNHLISTIQPPCLFQFWKMVQICSSQSTQQSRQILYCYSSKIKYHWFSYWGSIDTSEENIALSHPDLFPPSMLVTIWSIFYQSPRSPFLLDSLSFSQFGTKSFMPLLAFTSKVLERTIYTCLHFIDSLFALKVKDSSKGTAR